MEHYRQLVILFAIALPILAAFGWIMLAAVRRYNQNHHIISVGDMPTTPASYSLEEEETDKTYKEYVDANYC